MILNLDESIALIQKSSYSNVSREALKKAIDVVVESTRLTYEREAESYREIRGSEPSTWDLRMSRKLLNTVRERISLGSLRPSTAPKWRLLDVGAGYGRDARYFSHEPDVSVSVVENSSTFLNMLKRQAADGEISLEMILGADMRDLSAVSDNYFDCVRNNATLHHVPLAPYGLGADSVIAETRRILADSGVFQCLVKEGTGIAMTDTGEGLGQRFYQYYTVGSLKQLLTRHGLRVVDYEKFTEPRPTGDVAWIMMLAHAC